MAEGRRPRRPFTRLPAATSVASTYILSEKRVRRTFLCSPEERRIVLLQGWGVRGERSDCGWTVTQCSPSTDLQKASSLSGQGSRSFPPVSMDSEDLGGGLSSLSGQAGPSALSSPPQPFPMGPGTAGPSDSVPLRQGTSVMAAVLASVFILSSLRDGQGWCCSEGERAWCKMGRARGKFPRWTLLGLTGDSRALAASWSAW